MHIAMVVDNDLVSDVRVLNEALFLVNKGHKVSVLCFNHGNLEKIDNPILNNLDIHFFERSKWWKNKTRPLMTWLPVYRNAWRRRINRFFGEVNPDIIHVHDLYMSKTVDRKIVKVPIVLDLHELYPEVVFDYAWASKTPNRWIVNPKAWRKLEAEYIKNADGLIVLSENFKQLMLEKYPDMNNRISIYPNVPNIDVIDDNSSFEPIAELEDLRDKFVLFYFGQSAIRRGAMTMLDALSMVEQGSSVHLLLIGPIEKGDQRQIMERMSRQDVKDRITWIPWIGLSDLRRYLPYVDVCLSPRMSLPQYDCGVPNKVFQYMYFGKPILVSDSTAQKELIEKENAGWVYENGNSVSLRNAIEKAMNAPGLSIAKGENGRRAVKYHYNTEFMGNEILRLYIRLTKSIVDT